MWSDKKLLLNHFCFLSILFTIKMYIISPTSVFLVISVFIICILLLKIIWFLFLMTFDIYDLLTFILESCWQSMFLQHHIYTWIILPLLSILLYFDNLKNVISENVTDWVHGHFFSQLNATESTLVQVMSFCCKATIHYLSQCWPRSMSPYAITMGSLC